MQAEPIRAALSMLGLSWTQLWWDYLGLGGTLPPTDIKAFLDGDRVLSDHDHDILVQALNEYFLEKVADQPLLYADEMAAP